MIKVGQYELRNLEEQVEKNKNDIQDFKDANQTIAEFGIYVQGILSNISLLPEVGQNFGDAYLIGAAPPYDMRVWTRKNGGENGEWVDLGSFPLAGPKGEKGDIGSQIYVGSGAPIANPTTKYDYYLNIVNGELYNAIQNETGILIWHDTGYTLKGPRGERGERGYQGIQGIQGETGKTGPIGPQGMKGDKGDVGPAFNVQGTLTSTSQLPTPTAEIQDKGYCYRILDANGVPHIWIVEGANEVGPFSWVDIGVAGIQGPQGPAGKGIDTLTDVNLTLGDTTVLYDTTDGMQITSTGRFTYVDGQKDTTVDLDIPLVAGSGITIDKVHNKEQIQVKIANAPVINVPNITRPTFNLDSNDETNIDILGTNAVFNWQGYQAGKTVLEANTDSQSNPHTILTDHNTKTFFGDQSIYGEGNIDLYRHVVRMYSYGSSSGNVDLYLTIISSYGNKIDSLTDLFNVLEDYKGSVYPCVGYLNYMVNKYIYGLDPSANGDLYGFELGSSAGSKWNDSIATFTWTVEDVLTTV